MSNRIPSDLSLFPSPPPIPDAPARADALDITRSFIVEAPAGSGKTGLIIQRFLKLLASKSVTDPSQVLAITFTRKATAEMHERVFAQLANAAQRSTPANDFDIATRSLAEAVLARDSQLQWHLLDNPRRLNIRTIDSVCQDIARELPVLSGSGGGLTPKEDPSPLHHEAARRTLMLLGGPDQALSAALEILLLHRDGSLTNCQSLIATMLRDRDQWGELVPLAADQLTDDYLESVVLPKLEKALDHAICRALTFVSKTLPAGFLHELSALAGEMGHADGYNGQKSPLALCAGKPLPPEEKAAYLDHWHALIGLLLLKDGTFRKPGGLNIKTLAFMVQPTHKRQLIQLLEQVQNDSTICEALCSIRALPPAQYPAEQWVVTKALFRVLSRALVELQFVFADRSECDFAEIALLAKSALRRDSALEDLGVSAGINLQHLLVDEMQDTSSAQYELIQLLTQRWDGHSQTVFLVGDPKQSIYLFRQARVERFVRTMHFASLGDLPLTTLQLTANFRSQRGLVDHFNDDFALLFPPHPDPLRPQLVPYAPAVAINNATAARGRVWHATALPYSPVSAEATAFRIDQSRNNAAEIRRIVEQWRAKSPADPNVKPATAAVLVRNRTHLLDIVKAFRKPAEDGSTIPFRAVEIEPLTERQEILDLLALTRALLHPADRTAWLAILRAPCCGLSLADLHTLTGRDDPSFRNRNLIDLIAERGDLLTPDGIARLQPFWTAMSAALIQRGRLPLSRWVERTWRAFAAPAFLSPEALANAQRFFELLDDLEDSTGALDLASFDQRLTRLYASPSVHPNAVDLMTIHGAKGLEWDVVFVPALERTGAKNSSRLLSWLEIDAGNELTDDTVAHGIIAPIQAKGKASHILNTWMRSIESTRESAERKRLFYVACTRAQQELHLFAAPARKKEGDIARKADSLLHSAWPAIESQFTDAPGAQVILFPQPANHEVVEELIADLAATSELPRPPILIDRIPHHHMPAARATPNAPPQPVPPHFDRPEGSFSARAFGNTTHAFLQLLAERAAQGTPLHQLLHELPTWSPRITALLRASGLAQSEIQRSTTNILKALENTLTDPAGQWILTPHPESASESSLISWQDDTTRQLRIDRTFLAGPTPLSQDTTHRWIIDYKTTTHSRQNLDAFLEEEKQKYRAIMERYATQLPPTPHPIRVALYYPTLPALTWWNPTL